MIQAPKGVIEKENFREAKNDGKNGALMGEIATPYISKMHSMKKVDS